MASRSSCFSSVELAFPELGAYGKSCQAVATLRSCDETCVYPSCHKLPAKTLGPKYNQPSKCTEQIRGPIIAAHCRSKCTLKYTTIHTMHLCQSMHLHTSCIDLHVSIFMPCTITAELLSTPFWMSSVLPCLSQPVAAKSGHTASDTDA